MKGLKMNIKFFRKNKRKIAVTKLLLFVTYLFAPNVSFALTGGPSQPEVQSFEPIGTSDMVDLFTGDFTYNLPLMDVEGYPINLSYHSGVTMDQEASWVGLGWNVNPGVINRNIKGIPDDFNGDPITKEMGMKKNWTFGVSGMATYELFGLDFASIGYTLGMKYNNYRGFGFEQGLNLSINSGDASKGALNAGLGLNSSSDGGLTIQPSVGLSLEVAKSDKGGGDVSGSLGVKVGSSFNSRSGLKSLTISGSFTTSEKKTNSKNKSVRTNVNQIAGASSSFDFGGSTYTPNQELPMKSHSINGSFHVGVDVWGNDFAWGISGYYSSQALEKNQRVSPSYGMMNLQNGQGNTNAILDFNREKDGSFTTKTPSLPITNLTNDNFSVMGQGVGGSYRTFRGDVGYVFDPYNDSKSSSADFGLELSPGALAHFGADVNVTIVNTHSGKWEDDNNAINKLKYKNTSDGSLYEPVYFKEANEKSVSENDDLLEKFGGFEAKRLDLTDIDGFNYKVEDKLDGSAATIADNTKKNREKRAQVFSYLTAKQVNAGLGLMPLTDYYASAPEHHIAEISVVGTDGKRYIYGKAAYNLKQEEVTFASNTVASTNGLTTYTSNEVSTSNNSGRDGYYSKTTTPPFAHSYMLTAILSSDYADADGVQGPSEGDLGTYVYFHYTKTTTDYKWRTPVSLNSGVNLASFNEGLKSDTKDQKGSYLYGEKQIWYNDLIETKNYKAIFITSDRNDGLGVTDNNGQILNTSKVKKLDKIELWAKGVGLNAIDHKIKDVNFVYEQVSPLCPGTANSTGPGLAKLTLKSIYFTYQNSQRAKFSPYTFEYGTGAENPSYNIKGYDRWGNYKPNDNALDGLPNDEFPYAEQNTDNANNYAKAWSLNKIKLPSGGIIDVKLEADDYAYVQNKRAGQMFKIAGTDDIINSGQIDKSISDGDAKNRSIVVGPLDNTVPLAKYFDGIDDLYFRCLTKFVASKYDYVSGYAKINAVSWTGTNLNYAKITLKPVKLNDNGAADYNPIAKAAAQFCRMNLPEIAYGEAALQDGGAILDILDAIITTFDNFQDAFQGPNLSLWNEDKGRVIVCDKSWVRLNAPSTTAHAKYGGGARVQEIKFSDNWLAMSGEAVSIYGQTYSYKLEDGTSSGVASWEPALGGDENSWHKPVSFDADGVDGHLIPDDQSYMEEPFGESFFPSPTVGYSRVVIKNLTDALPNGTTLKRHGTGFTVHEYYTAKDFPTIAKRTDPEIHQKKTDPFSLASLFHIGIKDYLNASQGFAIETNDMHGKPKAQKVYQEGAVLSDPISSIEYKYKCDLIGSDTYRLTNLTKVVDKFGNVSDKNIGVMYDIVADMRESYTETDGAGIMFNTDILLIGIFPLPVPMVLPKMANEKTQFRSAGLTKVIQRFGILEETTATDLSSVVTTKNLAYDAETGEAILMQTINDFNDPMYTLNFPAHWKYESMGSAYKNISYKGTYTFSGLGMASGVANAQNLFTPGDEIIFQGTTNFKGWVIDVQANNITVMDKLGNPISGTGIVQVVRSGRKNQQAEKMASITTYSNPLYGIGGNAYQLVTQASAVEFKSEWAVPCNCADNILTDISGNPYVNGSRGNWRVNKSYSYLAGRSLSSYNDNVNAKKDGFFTSFNPFYYSTGSQWLAYPVNWTYASEVTQFDKNGQEVENRDALGRYSAALFSYRNTMNIATAANAKYNQIASENFESENSASGVIDCFDQHLKLNIGTSQLVSDAHTGRNALKVIAGGGTSPFFTGKLALASQCGDSNGAIEQEVQLNIGCVTSNSINYDIVNISGGAPPYQISWLVNSGVVSPFLLSGNSIQLSNSTISYSIQVTVQDALGNTTIQTFNNP